jgi:hypothetical protein
MFIHTIDDNSLLRVFWFFRAVMVDEDEPRDNRFLEGWNRNQELERWWYKLAHVCRRWRCLILASASHLNLCLVISRSTPVADMLTNSPPFPLIINYPMTQGFMYEGDEDIIILALEHRHRIRRIHVHMFPERLHKFVRAIDGEFPALEYLHLEPSYPFNLELLILPNTFRAPLLRHLSLKHFTFATRSPLITTSTGLVTLSLERFYQTTFLHPNDLLQQISLLPQLETLEIGFNSPFPSRRDMERQWRHRPITTRVTLPNLRRLRLRATNTYIESILPRMTTPLLEKFRAHFPFQLSYFIPRTLEFINAAQNLRFSSAKFCFHHYLIEAHVCPHHDDDDPILSFVTDIGYGYGHLDWQVSFVTQIFLPLKAVLTSVEHLSLEFFKHFESWEPNNDADPTQWRELLRLFSNVKTLRVNELSVAGISGSLQVDDGGSPLELLPELKELQYSPLFGSGDEFNRFIDARQKTGRPVTLVPY